MQTQAGIFSLNAPSTVPRGAVLTLVVTTPPKSVAPIATPSIQALIRDGKTYRITSDIQTGSKFGMNTLDSHLITLYQDKIISYGEMIMKAQDPQGLLQKLEGGKKR